MNLLGHVAKVGGAVFGGSAPEGYNEEEAAVEALLSRVSDGVLGEDRREALAGLRDLLVDNPQAQVAVGAMGFPVLTEVLREDREDTEMVQGALEVLINACGCPPSAAPAEGSPGATHNEVQAGALNSDLFAREPANTHLLLSLLEEEPVGVNDFYVRYHTVQLLTVLLSSSSYRLQDAILASPMGVVRLMDMMMDREVIRNEALLLLVALTRANEEVQKIAAFEGAFERLFNIIREEGALDGGIIVQDCLELLNNLLRGNQANQLMFREMGFLAQMPALLQVPPKSELLADMGDAFAFNQLPRQKAGNLLCALESVMLLITTQPAPGNGPAKVPVESSQLQEQNLVANKALLLTHGILDTLLALGVEEGGVSSAAVRVQALKCVAALVEGDEGNQERLGSASVRVGQQDLPALQAILRSALRAEKAAERAAAQATLRAYCAGNPDGQTFLASTIAPAGDSSANGEDDEGVSSFGGDLVRALVGAGAGGGAALGELQSSIRAAAVLSYLLDDNLECKQRVLRIPLLLPASASAPPELLMPRLVAYVGAALRTGGGRGRPAAAVLLRLLITWLTDCPPAVAQFLTPASHIPTLMDIANGKLGGGEGSVVPGLACVLAGVCLVYCPAAASDGPNNCGATTLLDVLSNRVGLTAYFSRWEELRRHPAFVAASEAPTGPAHFTRAAAAAATAEGATLDGLAEAPEEEGAAFDHTFTQFVAAFQEEAQHFVMTCYARPQQAGPGGASSALSWSGSEAEQLTAAKAAVAQMEREMEALRARNASLASSLVKAPGSRSGEVAPGAADGPGVAAHRRGPDGPAAGGASVEAVAAAEVRLPPDPRPALSRYVGTDVNNPGPPPSAVPLRYAANGSKQPACKRPASSRIDAPLLRPYVRRCADALPLDPGAPLTLGGMRASQAEGDARAAREQLAALQKSHQQTQSDLDMERSAHEAQKAAAGKLEEDMADLSGAYNALESHSYSLESQVKELQLKLKAMGDVAASQAGSADEAAIQARIEEALAEAQAEADESMTDLLECLGQEEAKVVRLREKLEELGVDVDALLEGIGEEEEEEEDGEAEEGGDEGGQEAE
eukprot:jgi/Tetstr1/431886/TSEL_021376.t2